MQKRSITPVVAASLACAWLSTACVVTVDTQGYTAEPEEYRFKVTGTPELALITFDGAIEVRAWERAEVVVEVEKRASSRDEVDRMEVKQEQEGNRIRVEVRRPPATESFFGMHTSRQAKLIASVPYQTNLLARSGDGSISIERVTGRLELRTGDGRIQGVDLGGEVTAHTGDGSVKLEAVDGSVNVTTGDGTIALTGKLSDVRAHSGDGTIAIKASPGSLMTRDWEIETGDGGLVLYLPSDFGADLDAYTGDGSVRSDLDVEVTLQGRENRRSLRGKIGSGGHLLRLRTGDGSINLRPF